jgi:hypothetical protein
MAKLVRTNHIPVFLFTPVEIRVENTLPDDKGEKRASKPGAEIDVVLEADTDATLKKHG